MILTFFALSISFAWSSSVATIRGVVDQTLSTIVNQDLKGEQARSAFQGLIRSHVDLRHVAQLLLSNNAWIQAIESSGSMNQLTDFIACHLSGIYASQIQSGKGAKVTVSDTVRHERDPILNINLDIVTTMIERPGQPKIQIDWYVIPGGNIVDAKVERQFRMSFTLRPQYAQLWKASNNNPSAFMQSLKSSGLC